ncbi:MAG: DNA (cytosine-5-)-methyltransferase [Halobacteriovoraceae bacterium]|nr:DNA (cytosine-5-)-methyltransferase [Halobacteriovoraceae bacterium]
MYIHTALNKILDFCQKEMKWNYSRDHLMAIISHWLQNPLERPIFLARKDSKAWLKYLGFSSPKELQKELKYNNVPFPPNNKNCFRFIDLFAGIGGFRISLQSIGGKCVFTSEWDKSAQKTYFQNYGEYPFGDIRNFSGTNIDDKTLNKLIPDHDILAAGFPCQPFSHAGVSARGSLGKTHGFKCKIQGTLFFDTVRIAKVKRPKILLLENVRNLQSHDKGKTFEIIRRTITEYLGYSFNSKILDSSSLVPQRRKRCFMVCMRNSKKLFEFPILDGKPLPLKSILEKKTPDKYTISDKLWEGHQRRTQNNLARGTGFTAFTANLDKPSNTIVARYGKDGKECLIPQKGKNPRKLTPKECARLLGFPEEFIFPEHDTSAYKQFGNSVVVPLVKKIVKRLKV